ncbi:MAG: 3-methylmercaptopropionyl-CoA dehydrogenase [Syntrophus sp. SKADARSKE-3]|nr:3-methylmercaptopropionyl-CoA dehydrogenase [Syntrophus sp. SKADARSKE-3]
MTSNLNDLRDTRFILYEQLHIEELCREARFDDHSRETFEMILTAAEKLAENDFAPANGPGDKIGCAWKEGRVMIPEPYRAPYQKFCEGGWMSLAEDYSVGGQNAPRSLHYACSMMFFAANHSLMGYTGLTHSAAKVIELYGTEEQKRKYMVPLYEGRYAGVMDLTEAQAGSDVGSIRTKAVRNGDGSFSITGSKIFITGGEQDLTENIIHILLARIEGDPEGTGGLTCFVLPKIRLDETGTMLADNDIVCSGIEHKMGMKGSATAVLNFGDRGHCQAELLGPERKGIQVMFHMMNEQRILVGMQGMAQASAAYHHTLHFASERRQGPTFGAKDTSQAAIINHPDVRRNLVWMKAHSEGMRALILFTAYCMDKEAVAENDADRSEWHDLVEILTPICKAYCSDRGFDTCVRAIQVHGGYGYCHEYKVEQCARDSKITSIYEGTNGIQAMDLFGRKIRMKKGRAFALLVDRMKETVLSAMEIDKLWDSAQELGHAVAAIATLTDSLIAASSTEDAYLAYSWATPYLEILGDVVIGWILIWQAAIACLKQAQDTETENYYEAKILTAQFYTNTILPAVHGRIAAINRHDRSLMKIEETHFMT